MQMELATAPVIGETGATLPISQTFWIPDLVKLATALPSSGSHGNPRKLILPTPTVRVAQTLSMFDLFCNSRLRASVEPSDESSGS
ncbi:uncharacterized protein CLUP02_08531 [Colletotrichum lupini]|uniref:Uncharacterized protein n=1 Tax=Colletotrichum lupini TaxID=145971 RepID=A0A9Q8ST50_9PEZI|nr:uncharacterized protein CLUP02_08531 [Colletotrichum lupini]UQC83041.1 hypothetical protein CLUP02_08531 [Colletotrichum lupini]